MRARTCHEALGAGPSGPGRSAAEPARRRPLGRRGVRPRAGHGTRGRRPHARRRPAEQDVFPEGCVLRTFEARRESARALEHVAPHDQVGALEQPGLHPDMHRALQRSGRSEGLDGPQHDVALGQGVACGGQPARCGRTVGIGERKHPGACGAGAACRTRSRSSRAAQDPHPALSARLAVPSREPLSTTTTSTSPLKSWSASAVRVCPGDRSASRAGMTTETSGIGRYCIPVYAAAGVTR